MQKDYFFRQNGLCSEADNLLKRTNLLSLLSEYGVPYVQGSHKLKLMTWRDLDILLEVRDLNRKVHFEVGQRLSEVFDPIVMLLVNTTNLEVKGMADFECLYWGVYTRGEEHTRWKIDICLVKPEVFCKSCEKTERLFSLLTNELRDRILQIKAQYCSRPEYLRDIRQTVCTSKTEGRLTYRSVDIYEAVLSGNVQEPSEFLPYLRRRQAKPSAKTF